MKTPLKTKITPNVHMQCTVNLSCFVMSKLVSRVNKVKVLMYVPQQARIH